MDIALRASELLWVGGLAAVPVALAVGGLSRIWKFRPATRHALWCAVLLSFITPVIAGLVWRPDWFSSGRLLAAADSLSAGVAEAPDEDPASPATGDPGPSPNRAAYEPETPTTAEHDRTAARLVGYIMGRALPALLGRTQEPVAGDAWPERMVNASRDISNAADLLGGLRSRGDRASGPVVPPAPDGPAAATSPADTIRVAELSAPVVRADYAATPLSSLMPARRSRTASAAPAPATSTPAARASDPAVVSWPPAAAAVPPAARPPESPTWRQQARAWLAAALAVRDSLADVPPIPAPVWAGGGVLIAGFWIMRVASARRLLGRGRAAPAEVRAMVRDAAARLELRRVPEVLVVDERISPMIWCGLRPRLVIPVGLWAELDEDSRLSVVLHELAHLRRRDHRLCWLESAVGLLYWWHPAAWWARRRIRDEADLACDAWVLSVMPGQRRAYAEALVTTKSYLSVPGCRATPGLGVMTGRTKRLARRLTMVMTQRMAPRTSAVGAALAMTVAMAGMFVTPGLACPPEEESGAKLKATVGVQRAEAERKAVKEKAAKAATTGRAAPRAQAGTEFFGEAPALEAMRARGGKSGGGSGGSGGGGAGGRAGGVGATADEDAQIRRLEEQLRVLEERLEQLNTRAGGRASAPRPAQSRSTAPGARGMGTSRSGGPAVIVMPPRAAAPVAPVAPVSPIAPAMPFPAPPAPAGVPSQPALPAPPAATLYTVPSLQGALSLAPFSATIAGDGQLARSYVLPEGKLEALTDLMSRDDVPVVIERHSDHIVVHATPGQHEIFAAFVKLIHPEAAGSNPLSDRYLDAARALGRNNVHRQAELAARLGQLQGLRGQLQSLTGQRAGLEAKAVDMEKRADEVRRRAEEMRERAEQLREQAEKQRSQRSDASPAELAETDMLLTSASQIEAEADAAEQAADELEARADAVEQEADALESAADDLESAFNDLDDEIGETSLAEFAPNDADEADAGECDDCGGCPDCHKADCDDSDCATADDCDSEKSVTEPTAPEPEAPATADGH